MTATLFVEVLPHVVFSTQVPTAGKVVELLVTVHRLQRLQVSPTHIKVNTPIVTLL